MGIRDWIRGLRTADTPDDAGDAAPTSGSPPRLGDAPHIERDLAGQILELGILDAPPHQPLRLEGSLAKLPRSGDLVSAAALIQKAKQFDDGLYAAVELAALHGGGERPARTAWLAELRDALGTDDAATSLYAAVRMLDAEAAVPGPLAGAVANCTEGFLGDELASKPIAFYTWTAELEGLFRHDRLLQSKLRSDQLEPVVRALHSRQDVRAEYESHLKLIERLTNPLTEDHVRRALSALDGGAKPSLGEASLLPASASHESVLIQKMYGDAPIPQGFDLMTELLGRVRSGAVDLRPTADSGWYGHQIWSLQPLAVPEEMPEAKHLRFHPDYREHLEDLLEGTWALARETHAKQLDMVFAGCAMPDPPAKPELIVQPEVSCEPLVTHYCRRADSYRFVRRVIEDHFGADALRSMHRQTIDGSVEATLGEELDFVTNLFDGAARTCEREIGASAAEPGDVDDVFASWDATSDPDLRSDIRMMVPVFYDVQRRKIKVWAVLGWAHRQLRVSFRQPPSIVVRDGAGADITANYDIQFVPEWFSIAYPEFAEVYVDRILDRDEFRALCDEHQTRDAILAVLA